MEDRTCPVCGNRFTPRRWNQKYCTGYRGQCYRRAMNAAYNARRGTETATCKGCGDMFERRSVSPSVRKQEYCTTACQYNSRSGTPFDLVATDGPLGPLTAQDVAMYEACLATEPCVYCGAASEHGDHVTPKAAGGGDGWDNLAPACKDCNEARGVFTLLGFMLWRTYRVEREQAMRISGLRHVVTAPKASQHGRGKSGLARAFRARRRLADAGRLL